MILLNKKAQKVSPECTSTQRGRRGEERVVANVSNI